MINHARTLILNDAAANRPSLGTYGEEYVPEAYRVLGYAGTLHKVRSVLIGSSGDPLYQNYQLAKLMDVVHANQYVEQYALSLDSRYTYRPYQSAFLDFDFSVDVEEINDKGMQLTTSGTPEASAVAGKALYRWTLRSQTGPQLMAKELMTGKTKVYDITVAGGLAAPVELENGLTVHLTVPGDSWQVDAEWSVTTTSRPSNDLSSVIADINGLGAGAVSSLFAGAPSSFYNLWHAGVSLVDQLGGALGSFIYQAEKVRVNG